MAVGLLGHAKLDVSIFFTVYKGITIICSYVGYTLSASAAASFTDRRAGIARTHMKHFKWHL
jgi:hypothetical protein